MYHLGAVLALAACAAAAPLDPQQRLLSRLGLPQAYASLESTITSAVKHEPTSDSDRMNLIYKAATTTTTGPPTATSAEPAASTCTFVPSPRGDYVMKCPGCFRIVDKDGNVLFERGGKCDQY